MEKEKRIDSEERTDMIVGLITVAVMLALFVWLIVSLSASSRSAYGMISAQTETLRGREQVFTYELNNANVKDGAKVTWTVNGEKVAESVYKKGEPVQLCYLPETTGQLSIKASAGQYSKTTVIEVLPPRLTVVAPNVTITYGDELPEMFAQVDGFAAMDDVSGFAYDNRCEVSAEKLGVGVYAIEPCRELSFMDYETEYLVGTLTVLPKELTVTNDFTKVYDGTNTICNPVLTFDGVVDGDEVNAVCDTLYFDNKNAGDNKTIMLANVELEGCDAMNYVLCDYATGTITPKCVDIVGLTVKDKTYDGTTKATIDKMGVLTGVCENDSVAIGNINVNFTEAREGMREYVASEVTLVGADKDNYVVNNVETGTANISSSIWSRLIEKEPTTRAN